MKKMMFTLIAMLTIVANANAMSYEQARNEALFLTDKMAYELNLSDAQYEAAYEINLDYLMGVTSQYDVYGPYWERRNLDLSYILFSWQWDAYCAATYFYRPLFWDAGYWHFSVYRRYPHRDYFYFGRPVFYGTYRGGHSWRMNGGRSFYEGRRDFYRPDNRPRDQHFGMRNGWDRGDYRPGNGGHQSSTHITGGNSGHPGGSFGNGAGNNGRHGDNGLGNNGRYDNNGGSRQGGFGSGRNGGNWRNDNNSGAGNVNNGAGNVNNGTGNVNHGTGTFGNGGSFGSGRSGGNSGNSNSGSFSGGTRNSNGGSFSGGTRSNSGGSFGGSRSNSGSVRSNSNGNFGGSRSNR